MYKVVCKLQNCTSNINETVKHAKIRKTSKSKKNMPILNTGVLIML